MESGTIEELLEAIVPTSVHLQAKPDLPEGRPRGWGKTGKLTSTIEPSHTIPVHREEEDARDVAARRGCAAAAAGKCGGGDRNTARVALQGDAGTFVDLQEIHGRRQVDDADVGRAVGKGQDAPPPSSSPLRRFRRPSEPELQPSPRAARVAPFPQERREGLLRDQIRAIDSRIRR